MKYIPMLIEFTKHLLLLLLLIAAAKLFAQESSIAAHTDSYQETQTCPTDFFQVDIPEGGKLCQIFATDLPASMVFFVPQPVQSVVNFYQNNAQFKPAQESLQRFIIRSNDNNITVIVSEDGSGTQVDILVKQDPSQ